MDPLGANCGSFVWAPWLRRIVGPLCNPPGCGESLPPCMSLLAESNQGWVCRWNGFVKYKLWVFCVSPWLRRIEGVWCETPGWCQSWAPCVSSLADANRESLCEPPVCERVQCHMGWSGHHQLCVHAILQSDVSRICSWGIHVSQRIACSSVVYRGQFGRLE